MASWDNAGTMAAQCGGGAFAKLENDGESMVVAFCGEPYPRRMVWTGTTYVPFDSDVHSQSEAAFKCACNVFDVSLGVMRVWDFGKTVLNTIAKCDRKYGLDKWTFEVTRNGAKGDKKTTYSIMPDSKIDEDLATKIEAAEMHDLEDMFSEKDDIPL